MRILLPTLHVRRSAQAVPLAAGNLKANLPEKFRSTTELLDLFPEQSLEQMQAAILAKHPKLIAFPLYLWNRQQVLRLCRQLRQKKPELLLLAGGPEASADAAAVIAEGELDGAICGEGESAFRQLLEQLENQQTDANIPGYQSAARRPQTEPVAASCPDLGALTSPWLSGTLPLKPGCGVLWEVARGCRFNCAFCFDAKGQEGVRPFPLERLHAELHLFATKEVGQIWILDSTFNAPPERGKQLLRLLLEQAPQIHYHLEAKADFLDQETAILLSQLSCSVQIGLQSAQPEVLKPLHRSLSPTKMTRALQLLSEYGITFGLDLIYGLPNDNHQGFCDSLDFALQQRPNQVDIFPLAVLPGTELHRQQEKFGICADPQPPYLIRQNRSYSKAEMQCSEQLATATDIFYNRGRAVGFFAQLCHALKLRPVELLESFNAWLMGKKDLSETQKSSAECWQPKTILPLQQQFIAELFRQHKANRLLPLVEDLINYHFCCAELLLAEECMPVTKSPSFKQAEKQRWQLNPALRIQAFNYELAELEEFGWDELSRLAKRLQPAPGYAIFLRQQGEPLIESLDDEFARLLLGANGRKTGKELAKGLHRQQAEELLLFAVNQGLLLPAT